MKLSAVSHPSEQKVRVKSKKSKVAYGFRALEAGLTTNTTLF